MVAKESRVKVSHRHVGIRGLPLRVTTRAPGLGAAGFGGDRTTLARFLYGCGVRTASVSKGA